MSAGSQQSSDREKDDEDLPSRNSEKEDLPSRNSEEKDEKDLPNRNSDEDEDSVPEAPTRRPKPGPVRCHTGKHHRLTRERPTKKCRICTIRNICTPSFYRRLTDLPIALTQLH